jgi:hypothetical protein
MSKTTTLLTEERLKRLEQAEVTGRLTRKQAAFVRRLIEEPKISATQAYLQSYNTTSVNAAKVEASRTLAKPNVLAVLRDAVEEAESTLTNLQRRATKIATSDSSKTGAAWASVARGTANDILDRVHGKATQRTEVTQAVVTLNIDLSSST